MFPKYAKELLNSIKCVSNSVQLVSVTSQQTAANAEKIMNAINEAVLDIKGISKSIHYQVELAGKLNYLVQKFSI